MPDQNFIVELEELGLTASEAQAYIALLNHGSLAAATVAQRTGIHRSNVYAVLSSLAEKGLIEPGTGYGSKFSAVLPDAALRLLIVRERETLAKREKLASDLAERMAPFAHVSEAAPEELVQVLRDSTAVAQRFERLVLDAEREIETFVKGPILNPHKGNSVQEKAQRRGVCIRALYERALIEDPAVKPYLEGWVAGGEVARVYDGELPHKLVIFDRRIVLMPLLMPGEQTKTLLIRHAQLAESLSLAFQYVWDRAEPLVQLIQQGATNVEAGKRAILSVQPTERNDKPARAT
jgi:sugar-specific transcriptional regulator TrmB